MTVMDLYGDVTQVNCVLWKLLFLFNRFLNIYNNLLTLTLTFYQANDCPERCVLAFLELLPTMDCVTPYEAQQLMKSGQKSKST